MEAQAELIPLELLPDGFEILNASPGESTGERVKKHRPLQFEAACRLLAENYSRRATARATGLHVNTVCAIAEDPEARVRIETEKQSTVRNLKRFRLLASERMLEEVEKFSPMQLAIAMGIATEKALLLDGQPTQITGHLDASKRVVDLDALEAELVDRSATGLGGESGAQKELTSGSGGDQETVKQADIDSASTGSAS